MPLVPAKCTQCGATLTVDPTNGAAAVCPFCGTPFVVEQAVNNYNISNQTTIGTVGHVEHLHVNDERSVEARLASAETSLAKLGDYDRAFEVFESVADDKADEWRAWWGMARAKTHDFRLTALDPERFDEARDYAWRAVAVAPDDAKPELQERLGAFLAARAQGEAGRFADAFADVDPGEIERVDRLSAREMKERFRELDLERVRLEALRTDRKRRGSEELGCLFYLGMTVLVIGAIVAALIGMELAFSGSSGGSVGGAVLAVVVAGALMAIAVVWGFSVSRRQAEKDHALERQLDAARTELARLRGDLDLKKRLAQFRQQWPDLAPRSFEQQADDSVLVAWTGFSFE